MTMIIDGGRIWRIPGGGQMISSTPPDRYEENGKVYDKHGREVLPVEKKTRHMIVFSGSGTVRN